MLWSQSWEHCFAPQQLTVSSVNLQCHQSSLLSSFCKIIITLNCCSQLPATLLAPTTLMNRKKKCLNNKIANLASCHCHKRFCHFSYKSFLNRQFHLVMFHMHKAVKMASALNFFFFFLSEIKHKLSSGSLSKIMAIAYALNWVLPDKGYQRVKSN